MMNDNDVDDHGANEEERDNISECQSSDDESDSDDELDSEDEMDSDDDLDSISTDSRNSEKDRLDYEDLEEKNNDLSHSGITNAITPATPLATTTTALAVGGEKETPNIPFLGRAHFPFSPSPFSSPVPKVDSPATKAAKNKKSRCTSKIIDLENIPDINIIVPLKSLLSLIESQFVCKRCRNVTRKMTCEVETFGVVSSLHYRCNCGLQSTAAADLTTIGKERTKTIKKGCSFGNKINASHFEVNNKIILGLQLGGAGQQELRNLSGMLNLNNNPMKKRVTQIRENLGMYIMEIAKEVLAENLQMEKIISPTHSDNSSLLSVSNDARWDKRSSGRRYDSMSGCSVMVGNRTKLVIGLEAMSMQCIKCTKNIGHTFDQCSHNFDGSSKAMESTGALVLLKRVTTNSNLCYIQDYVSDDDSSSRNILTHSVQEMIDAGRMLEADRPRYNSVDGPGTGANKPDNGCLPIDHIEINFLADKNHRVRIYAKPFFALAGLSKKKNHGVTNIDAERMKRRMSWTLRLFTGGTFEEFETAVEAVLEHHFDNHEHCGEWCKAKGKTGQEKLDCSMKFRSKTENKEMYLLFKQMHDEFMEKKSLKQLFHQWDTNAVKGFNKLITEFLPKDRNFATTNENKIRIHLACCLLSIGYDQFYRRLYEKAGLTMGEYCLRFIAAEDKERQWRKIYRKKESTKVTRMRHFYTKIREGREKLVSDAKKGLAYSSGMMGPGSDNNNEPPSAKKQKKKNSATCHHCGAIGHSRRTHSLCGANPKNLGRAREAAVENGGGIRDEAQTIRSETQKFEGVGSSSYLREVAEMEALEQVSFNDVSGRKYGVDVNT